MKGERSSPRAHEDVQQAEESRSVSNVEDVTVQEGVELGEEVGELAVWWRGEGRRRAKVSFGKREEDDNKEGRAYRLCFCMRVKRPLRARIPIVPPV